MILELNNQKFNLSVEYFTKDGEFASAVETDGKFYADGVEIDLILKRNGDRFDYSLSFEAGYDSALRLSVSVDERDVFHLIPCNIYGDNNHAMLRPDEMPVLTADKKCSTDSDMWEFRADRAALPVSVIAFGDTAIGISISPYDNDIRNGVFSRLPDECGVSLGYTNYPYTFTNKGEFSESTFHRARKISAEGSIFAENGRKRLSVHKVIRKAYEIYHSASDFADSIEDACKALVSAFCDINWYDEFGEYTNQECEVPDMPVLNPWRPLVEIGWTGGTIIAYPMLAAKQKLGITDEQFKKTPEQMLDEIADCYNPDSGFFYDLTAPTSKFIKKEEQENKNDTTSGYKTSSSRVNGWWSGFGLAKDVHCAYTNGHACYYLLKAYKLEKRDKWADAACKVLDTVLELQRDDGAFGYTFDIKSRKVADFDGFAGCWFVPGMALAFELTSDNKYLEGAKKALDYYYTFVKNINCYGTPMDTWKSIDEEGNIAFVKGSVLLHSITKDKKYLDYAVDGAEYEYLWRYGFKAKPELRPLKDSHFNSCGGSVTSVSNPHIHPMGLLLNEDLRYIAHETKDLYHESRADDGVNFALNIMSLYPEVSGYGRYGVLTERYCPSDGLVIEEFSSGEKSALWFSYNGWAAANTLESLLSELQ